MKKIELIVTCAAANSAGFASAATGAIWPLTATTPGDHLGHLLTLKNNTATDHSAKTALIVGIGPGGEGITETLHLPTGSTTVSSTQYYATLTSITPSSTLGADTMDIGWAVNAVSAWQHCVTNVSVFNLGFGCTVTSGSPTYTVQSSFGDGTGFNHPTVASQTTSASGSVGYPIAALRLLFTAAGSVALNALQTDA